MNAATLEFSINGEVVGYFKTSEFPRTNGTYRYEPYRGPGHYHLWQTLQSAGAAVCYYETNESWVFFSVRPDFFRRTGRLRLKDFRTYPRQPMSTDDSPGASTADADPAGLLAIKNCPLCAAPTELFEDQKVFQTDEITETEKWFGCKCTRCSWSAILWHGKVPSLRIK